MEGEHLDFGLLRLGKLHPGIHKYLLWSEPLQWVSFQNLLEDGKGTFGDISRGPPTALDIDYLLLELSHIGGLEGHRTEEHGVEHNSSTPNIGLETAVALPFEYFGSDVRRRTALLMLNLVLALYKLAYSKIANLDIALRGQQDVVQLDVAMEHALAVHIHQALDQLTEHVLRQVFLQLSASPNVRQEVAAAADLHDVDRVRLGVEALVEPHNVLVPCPLQDVVLLHDLLQGALICHVGLVDRLQGHELAGEPVDRQVDFAEGALANDLADLIVVNLRLVLAVHDI